ncbi:PEP/pyruvate-binding domain-containing protein [Methanobrevibacter millerae]|uniref:Phosphoenolpyruvate synthase/pyruvate phosphate dikinase n=1 Tax=Methanobrevibacter millerae TaxID=230361 RepID=A0A0U3CY45_9EURY|nr:PEP/pyruvate-binding domain-containing protein [Methanobrevibacter millerae]ALT69236.1 phosphoenolpyruvate synthase/pyruvate phosphate dikinase [Methanobrevibacter millerae]
MAAFDRVKSGIPGLDKALDNIRLGDNVVWNVTNLNEFSYFVNPYVKQAKKDNRNLIYIRFATHPPLIEMTEEDLILLKKEENNPNTEFCMIERDGIKIYMVNPYNQFETFTLEVHRIIEKEGYDAFYVFDCLSDLQAVWSTDLMMGNFFKVTCPFLFDLDTVAFFPIIRGRHSYDAIAKIRETTQLFLNVYSNSPEEVYVTPLKVWNRYSQTMFLGHKFNPQTGFVKVLQDGQEVSKYYKTINSNKYQDGRTLDSWERYMIEVRRKHDEGENIDDECDKICELMMTKDEKMLSKIKEYFTFEDYITIYDRRVGSGLVGGKTCGMLLARKIIEKNCPDIYNDIFEPDDSFYIGTDLFYTYIVSNDLWDLRVKQRTKEGYYKYGKELEEALKNGVFSDEIKKEFIHILDYFGQNPIIVRSSSFLEDGYGNAFAGKYESVFCVNRGSLEERLAAFEEAVKIVYSSTMNISALEYRKLNDLDDTDEQMGLLVQRVSGSYHGDYLFPTAAGVGFSYSPYSPLPNMDNSKGMLRLVMGLGTKAVDRTKKDYPRIVNLDKPEVTMTKDIKEKHRYSQHYLDVIDLKNISLHDIPIDEGLDVIPRYSKNVMVEHDREAERMFRDRGQPREIVFVNCEGIVKNHEFIDVMKRILNTLEIAYDYPVDIEYTVNVGENKSFNINLLQCRPLQVSVNNEAIEMPENQNVFFHIKESSMGMSRKSEIDIICYVDPHKYYEYPYAQKSSLSRIISDVNAYCKNNDKTALLIVPGRIGTSSPELGIPVVFADISHFTAILEEAYSDVGYMPELSFGSHMFQDLVEAEIYYGALFENEKRIEFNRDMIFDYPNILNDINPNLNDEIYDMIQVIDFDKDKAELYHDMNKDETMCIFK